jgi:hypothetical protein
MAAAWKEITQSFNIGNLMMKKLVIRINHYRHFSIRDGEDFESYLGRVLLVIGEYRELNKGVELEMCDLLGFLCVGMGSLFTNVISDLGRMKEEDMDFEQVVFLIRQSLLNQNVSNTVTNFSNNMANNGMENIVDSTLLVRHKSGLEMAKNKANKRKINFEKKSAFAKSNAAEKIFRLE